MNNDKNHSSESLYSMDSRSRSISGSSIGSIETVDLSK